MASENKANAVLLLIDVINDFEFAGLARREKRCQKLNCKCLLDKRLENASDFDFLLNKKDALINQGIFFIFCFKPKSIQP